MNRQSNQLILGAKVYLGLAKAKLKRTDQHCKFMSDCTKRNNRFLANLHIASCATRLSTLFDIAGYHREYDHLQDDTQTIFMLRDNASHDDEVRIGDRKKIEEWKIARKAYLGTLDYTQVLKVLQRGIDSVK
jgi:hypothetical protein